MTQPGAGSNKIDSEETAISTVQNGRLSEPEREEAIEYLRRNPSPEAIQVLITTLEDDDYGVRWAAGAALAQLGDAAWPPLLRALAKPDNSIRLRKGARHVLHYTTSPKVRSQSQELLRALKGQEAALSTEVVAHRLLRQLG